MSSCVCPRRCSSRHYIIDATRLDGWREDDGAAEIKPRDSVPGSGPRNYSPDFNPIEQFFAKLKAVLRKLAAYTLKGAAYSIESLCKTIAACLDEISRAECAAYLANAGYQPKRKML